MTAVWLQQRCTAVGGLEQHVIICDTFSKIKPSELFSHVVRL